jgi:hypothetical protein
MTHIGTRFFVSTGLRIGTLQATALMLCRHLSRRDVHLNGQLFLTQPTRGVVYELTSGM